MLPRVASCSRDRRGCAGFWTTFSYLPCAARYADRGGLRIHRFYALLPTGRCRQAGGVQGPGATTSLGRDERRGQQRAFVRLRPACPARWTTPQRGKRALSAATTIALSPRALGAGAAGRFPGSLRPCPSGGAAPTVGSPGRPRVGRDEFSRAAPSVRACESSSASS